MKELHMAAFLLVFVGALNWGLMGLFGMNLVMNVLGAWPMVEKLVYILVGVSGLYLFATHMNDCKVCGKGMKKK